jgi:hypothetical protein
MMMTSTATAAAQSRTSVLWPDIAYGLRNMAQVLAEPLDPAYAWLQWQVLHEQVNTVTQVEAITESGAPVVATLTGVVCTPIPGGLSCRADVPDAIRAAWSTVTELRVQLVVDGVPVTQSTPIVVRRPQDPPVPLACRYVTPEGTVVTHPVGHAIGGYMSNDLAANAARIGQLRQDGWRVEWHFEPGNPGAAAPQQRVDRLVTLFWCHGTPQ